MKRRKKITLKELKRKSKSSISILDCQRFITENCYFELIDRSKWY